MILFDSLNEIQQWVLESLLKEGRPAQPRGLKTLEIFPGSIALRKPRRRCVTNPARRWSFPVALGEFAWHTAGSNDLGFVSYYLPRWREMAGHRDSVRGSCYGYRVFRKPRGRRSQWDRVIDLLRADPWSRRAVLYLQDTRGLRPGVMDAACACVLQFLLRDEGLHLVVYMRSNDAIWGLPYDVFLFTMLQEMLACELDWPLGSYFHIAGSLHLYERHFELARKIIDAHAESSFEMPPMLAHQELGRFLEIEELLRSGASVGEEKIRCLDPYWRELIAVLSCFRIVKQTGGHELGLQALSQSSLYRRLLENLWGDNAVKGSGVRSHNNTLDVLEPPDLTGGHLGLLRDK